MSLPHRSNVLADHTVMRGSSAKHSQASLSASTLAGFPQVFLNPFPLSLRVFYNHKVLYTKNVHP